MRMPNLKRKLSLSLMTGTLALAALAMICSAAAQSSLTPTKVDLPAATLRTLAQMQAADKTAVPAAPAGALINRPTMDPIAYAAAKDAAARATGSTPAGKTAVAQLSPTDPFLVCSAEGVNQATGGGWYPSDSNGAAGHQHFVEVVNNRIQIYTRGGCPPVLSSSMSMNAFVGYFTQPLFDPNIVYDARWKRFVFTCPAFQETTAPYHAYFFIAVTAGTSPLGPWWIYALDYSPGTPNFTFDYPHVGFDNDAVQWTANIFNPGYTGSYLGTIAKSIIYNGIGGSFWQWGGLIGTLQPTLVRDQNVNTWIAAATPNNNVVNLYALQNSARLAPSLFGPYNVPVAAYTVPPNAHQPGTTATLDSLDNRFQNHSCQKDNFLWATHCVALGPFPAIRWYRIDTTALALNQSGITFASGTSDDWNPHITANGSYAWLEWSATDSPAGINAQVRFSGKLNGETFIDGGGAIWTSPTFYGFSGVQRWGDYSAVSLDPLNGKAAWIVNQKIDNNSTWGTRFGQITFP